MLCPCLPISWRRVPPPPPVPFPFSAVKRGDRIAQLILERIATPQVAEVGGWVGGWVERGSSAGHRCGCATAVQQRCLLKI